MMFKIFLIIILLSSFVLKLDAYFSDKSCEKEKVFYLVETRWKEIKLSNFTCEYWKSLDYKLGDFTSLKSWNIVTYDKDKKTIKLSSKLEILNYTRVLKKDILAISKDEEIKEKIIESYLSDFTEYDNNFFKLLKSQIFSKEELENIEKRLEKMPLKIFQNTYWQRLLMNWRVISREEWWADESYSKKEVYMKWCENWSCFTWWPTAKNELKENYMKYFNEIDKKNKITKTYDDWRDPSLYFPVDRIIIHHTAWGYKWIKSEGMAYMKSVQKYHSLSLRWWDIWYHYLIDWEGNIYEWRAGGKYVLWAHVSTHNYWSIWISLMSDWYYSPEMLQSMQDLIVYLWEEYDLDLTKKTTVRNNDLTWWTQGWVVVAHKELDSRKPTDPDINMDEFRTQIVEKINLQKLVLKYKKND